MGREPIRDHRSFQQGIMRSLVLWGIRRRFHRLCPSHGYVAHALRTLVPVAASVLLHRAAPRLACVKPAASVHPEPGSNSSLYIHYINLADPDNVLSKEINALGFKNCSRYLLVLPSVFSMIFSKNPARFRTGLQRYKLFLSFQIFLGKISKNFNFFCSSKSGPLAPRCVTCPYTDY